MARLEDAGLVAGEYDQKIVDGQIIKERRYALTPARRRGVDLDARVLQRARSTTGSTAGRRARRARSRMRDGRGAPARAGGRCARASSIRRSPTRARERRIRRRRAKDRVSRAGVELLFAVRVLSLVRECRALARDARQPFDIPREEAAHDPAGLRLRACACSARRPASRPRRCSRWRLASAPTPRSSPS